MSLQDLTDAIVFNRYVAYVLITLMIMQVVADVIIFKMSITILRRARQYLDLAAKHGKETDLRAARIEEKVDANRRSDVFPPGSPEARQGGCSPAVLIPLTAILLFLGWSANRAEAAQEMRRTNEATALAWWAAEQADTPLCGS